MSFEIVDEEEFSGPHWTEEYPLEPNQYEENCEECGGKQFVTGTHSYYNGSYQCLTLTLDCENCGPYDVECV